MVKDGNGDRTGLHDLAQAWAGMIPAADLRPDSMTPDNAPIARALQQGLTPSQVAAIWPDIGARLAAVDPEGPGPYPGSTWRDLGAVLGPITWEWPHRIPAAMLTELVAAQGMGKSCLCLRLAACYLQGLPWPDGQPFTGKRGGVLWCEAEASQGLNYNRAIDWGLPDELIYSPLDDPLAEVLLQDPDHKAAIESWAHRPEVSLVVVDSLSGANTAKENDAQMLHVVKWLASLAVASGKPIILTHHLRKRGLLDNGERVTLDRIRGSGAITQSARSVLALDAPDPNHEEELRLSCIKNNLVGVGNAGAPLGMTIDAQGVHFTQDAPEAPKTETLKDKAGDLLQALLAKGPRKSTDLQAEFTGAGISMAAAYRAAQDMSIVKARKHDPKTGKDAWYWSLPVIPGFE